jgi:hypothetical protein
VKVLSELSANCFNSEVSGLSGGMRRPTKEGRLHIILTMSPHVASRYLFATRLSRRPGYMWLRNEVSSRSLRVASCIEVLPQDAQTKLHQPISSDQMLRRRRESDVHAANVVHMHARKANKTTCVFRVLLHVGIVVDVSPNPMIHVYPVPASTPVQSRMDG